jgi:predicted FMN-binding regulatory protein PaiB
MYNPNKNKSDTVKMLLTWDYLERQIYQQRNTYENMKELKRVEKQLTDHYRQHNYNW